MSTTPTSKNGETRVHQPDFKKWWLVGLPGWYKAHRGPGGREDCLVNLLCDPKLFILTSLVVSNIFHFHPDPWGKNPFWHFSNGLTPQASIHTPNLVFEMTSDDSWDVHESELKCAFNLCLVPQGGLLATLFCGKNSVSNLSDSCYMLGSARKKRYVLYIIWGKKHRKAPAVSVEGFAGEKISKKVSNSSPNEFGNPTKSHQMNGVTY